MVFFIHVDRYDYPIHAEWLGGFRWRISRDDRQRFLPDEGCRSSGRIVLLAKTGCSEGGSFHQVYARGFDKRGDAK
jgi:hypothetical protein